MSDRVHVTIDDHGVADVRLNRPDKMNALDRAMFDALVATGRELARSPRLRAVVLSGEGRAFSAGLDFASFMAMGGGREGGPGLLERATGDAATHAQMAAWVWRTLPVPVIAAVHGVAYGGGCQIALAADVRLVAADARFSVMEIKWGLVPDMTGTQTLRHLVRQDVARELTYTGRIVHGTEAVALGLATRVVDDPRAAALALAAEIAGKSPDAIRAAKRLLDAASTLPTDEGLAREADEQARLIGTPNQLEAVQANLAQRPPVFSDPAT